MFDKQSQFTVEATVNSYSSPSNNEIRAIVNGAPAMSIKHTHTNWHVDANGAQKTTVYVSSNGKPRPEARSTTHVAGVWDGRAFSLYINGIPIPSKPLADIESNHSYNDDHRGSYCVGAWRGRQLSKLDHHAFFHGLIDEVRISNIARYDKDFTPAKRFETDKNTEALYHFDSGSGDVLKDSSGNGHHGKIVGAKWVRVDDELKIVAPAKPKGNHALEFDGKGSHVETPDLGYDTSKSVTLEATVKMQSAGRKQSIFSGPYGSGVGLQPQGTLAFSVPQKDSSAVWVQADNTFASGSTVHLAAVSDGKQIRLYINGKGQAHTESVTSTVHIPARFRLGVRAGGVDDMTNHFHGIIDEVRISNIARYDKDFTPAKRFEADKNTLALYHFDSGSGDVLKDSSGNGHHGKIVGAKWVRVDDELKIVDPAKPKGNHALEFDGKGSYVQMHKDLKLDVSRPLTLDLHVSPRNQMQKKRSTTLLGTGGFGLGITSAVTHNWVFTIPVHNKTPVPNYVQSMKAAAVYSSKELPEDVTTLGEAEGIAAETAREHNKKVCLVWTRRLSIWFDEQGQMTARTEASPESSNIPYMRLKGSRRSFVLQHPVTG